LFIFSGLFFLEKSFDKRQGATYNHAHCPARRRHNDDDALADREKKKKQKSFFSC